MCCCLVLVYRRTTQFSSDPFRSFLEHGRYSGDVLLLVWCWRLWSDREKSRTERLRLLSSAVIFANASPAHAQRTRHRATFWAVLLLYVYSHILLCRTGNVKPPACRRTSMARYQKYPAATASYDLSKKVQLAPKQVPVAVSV